MLDLHPFAVKKLWMFSPSLSSRRGKQSENFLLLALGLVLVVACSCRLSLSFEETHAPLIVEKSRDRLEWGPLFARDEK